MKIIECQQGTPEWWLARRGIPSASEFGRILTPKTMKLSTSADEYIYELIADLYRAGPPDDTEKYVSRPMLNGTMTEPEARRWYEMECGLDVRQVGFCVSDCGRFGFSPDGLVSEEGGLELKCPTLKVHIKWLLAGVLPDDHKAQVHGALHVGKPERKWWDFVSYCVDHPARLKIRVYPDEYTARLGEALEEFHERYQSQLEKVRAMV